MKRSTNFAQCFAPVDCFFYGMYGDCSYLHEAAHDDKYVCLYSENPAACYCAKRAYMNDADLKPKGSVEKLWKYAHPHDVGVFRDGECHGWFIRHESYLSWEPAKLKQWLQGKPCNIYLPGKMGIYPRPKE